MIAEWKCSECHPNSGEFYVGERASIRFCEDYCVAVFEKCKDIPLDVQGEVFYLNDPPELTAKEWCKGRTAPNGKCFAGHIPDTEDTKCKCRNQDCHNNKTEL